MTAFEPLNIVRPLSLRVDNFLNSTNTDASEGYGKTILKYGDAVAVENGTLG